MKFKKVYSPPVFLLIMINLAVTGSLLFSPAKVGSADGDAGWALSFDGSSAYVRLTYPDTLTCNTHS